MAIDPLTGGLAIGSGIAGLLAGGDQATTIRRAPEDAALAQLLRQDLTRRMLSPIFMGGLEAGGIANINQAFAPIQLALSNNLAARGLSTSPVAGAASTALQLQRGASIADFMNQVPLIERDLRNQDYSTIANFVNAQPTQTVQGNRAGSAATSAMTMLAYLQGLSGDGGGSVAIPRSAFAPAPIIPSPLIPGYPVLPGGANTMPIPLRLGI